ncbi:MAG: hypothetical protein RL437_618 [Actinomycetota bacterium]|jgi:hypothetical protein
MSQKLSFEEAAKIMRAAKLEPIGEYLGNKLPWKCKCLTCGSEVSPSLASVRTNGGGCRKCGIEKSAGARRISEQDAVLFMKKAGALPLEPYQNSKIPWLCRCLKCKREIKPTLDNVKNRNTNPCAYCAKKKVHPEDAIRLMKKVGLQPLSPYPGSNTKWKCRHIKCGEVVYPMLSWIVAGQGGCQKCGNIESGLKGRVNENIAKQVMEKAGLIPLEPYSGAGKPWKCKCLKCEQIVSPTYGSIKSGTGCGVCAGKIVPPLKAVAVMTESMLEPLEPYPGGKTPWRCRCLRCNREVTPKYADVRNGDGGCKYCGGHYVEPEIAFQVMQAKGVTPLEPYSHNAKKWHCICNICNRDVYPTWNSVQSGRSACAYCARRKVDAEEASIAMRSHGANPLEPYPGARSRWSCECLKCGRKISPDYSSVINMGQNPCGYCAGKRVDPKSAFIIMTSAGLTPLEDYVRADKPWRCVCNKCEKVVTPTYTSIRLGQGGCRYCANKGLDYNESAYLYLVTHAALGAHKVGIANDKTRVNRIKEHQKYEWILFKSIKFETGDDAFQTEQQVLMWLRQKKGLGIFLSKEQLPQGGYSETVDASEIDLATIWAKVEEFSKIKK